MRPLVDAWRRFDARFIALMSAYGISTIRIALAAVFIWFGALKIIGRSPVVDLVSRTVYFFPPDQFVPFLGWWELVVGFGLLLGRALRLTLFLFWVQLAGTFLVLVLLPHVAFQHGNPFLLTTEGEFVVKNLVLIAAGLVIGGTVRPAR